MTVARTPSRHPRWLRWLWPLPLLLLAWLLAPLRAGGLYPGMPCTANADTVFRLASYTLLFIPTAAVLLLLARFIRRARQRGLRVWSIGLAAAAAAVGVAFLVFGGISVANAEQSTACPTLGAGLQSLHCWRSGSTIEMNAYGQRPLDVKTVQAMAAALATTRQDAQLYEAFVLDTTDASIAAYSNARLFLLSQQQTDFRDLCLAEHQAKLNEVQSHRVGFYRYSARQSPPVDAFFLRDQGPAEVGYEAIDFLNGGEALPYVRPTDLQPAESGYLDRVAAALGTLNADLDREAQTPLRAGALATMRQDFTRITAELATGTPPRLVLYRDTRVRRFLENYDLILTAEENAAQGQTSQAIHSSAYEQHRRYYYQEPRVTRLIGYLYLQVPGRPFSDDELSTVNWAVF